MIHVLLTGQLISDPVQRQTRTGGTFVTGTVRVSAGADSVVVGLVTFDAAACERLLKLQKGSGLSAAGVLEANTWVDREGNEKSGWRMVANEVMSLAQAQRQRKKQQGAEANEHDEALA
jgi:single-stranded DNA-binding protein